MFRTRKCYCMNNSYQNDSCQMQDDMMEKQCNNVISYEDMQDSCACGFEDEERGTLFFVIKEILKQSGTKVVVLENVKNIVKPHHLCRNVNY